MMNTAGSLASQRLISTFCWLPPDRDGLGALHQLHLGYAQGVQLGLGVVIQVDLLQHPGGGSHRRPNTFSIRKGACAPAHAPTWIRMLVENQPAKLAAFSGVTLLQNTTSI